MSKLAVITEAWQQADTVVQENVICHVKLCGLKSKKGRVYTESCLNTAVQEGLYEGVPVMTDHDPENYEYTRKVGYTKDTQFVPGLGVYGSVCLNPKHVLYESIRWDAKENIKNIGYSHCVEAEFEGRTISRISRVRSVDLCIYPATTDTFTESEDFEKKAAEVVEAILTEAGDDHVIDAVLEHPKFKEHLEAHKAACLHHVMGEYHKMEAKCESLQGAFDKLTTDYHVLDEQMGRLSIKKPVAKRSVPTENPKVSRTPADRAWIIDAMKRR